MIEFNTYDGTGETRAFLELLDEFMTKHGYPNSVGVLIVPLMEDGFGVLGAMRGQAGMTAAQAFEYLRACVDQTPS